MTNNPEGEPCPDCGDESCTKSLAYVGDHPDAAVHQDKHPENKNWE